MATPDPALLALLIFALRVLDYTVGTVRTITVARDLRGLSALLGFIGPLIFVTSTSQVVTDMGNLFNLLMYCLGSAVGSYVGMVIEARFVVGFTICRIISQHHGAAIADLLRDLGHGVTAHEAVNETRAMTALTSVVNRRDVPDLLAAIYRVDPQTFVTLRPARSVRHGWLRALRYQK
jgi:uncharacterized protein YebE (UPF0316 family)